MSSSDDHCAIHGFEPLDGTEFRICGECWHAYKTEADLLAEYNRTMLAMAPLDLEPCTNVGQIFSCPLCTHDF